MDFWHAYLDESYDSKTFCVGGILVRESVASKISGGWLQRIDYENRKSAKKGFGPIRRYHAADCASLKRDFSEKNGWNIERQIRFTKRLCEILSGGATGIVVGGSIAHVKPYLAPGGDLPAAFLYSLCFRTCLLQIAALMRYYGVDSRVRIFYERGEFQALARESVAMLQADPNSAYRCFVSAEQKGWEDCTLLQTADLMAYEGFKRVGGSLKGSEAVRKSLQAILGRTQIVITHFQDENFADIVRMSENKREGRPLDEGVTSGLRACHGTLPYLPGTP